MVMAIIVFLIMMFCIVIAEELLNTSYLPRIKEEGIFDRVSKTAWRNAILVAAVVAITNYIVGKLNSHYWIGIILMAVIAAVFVWVISWWCEEGSNLKEMIPFLVMAVILFLVMLGAAYLVAAFCGNHLFIRSIIIAIPTAFLVVAIFSYFISWIYWLKEVKPTRKGIFRTIGRVLIIVACLLLLLLAVKGLAWRVLGNDLNVLAREGQEDQQDDQDDEEDDEEEDEWYSFFNHVLLEDEDESNDFNFGPNPYVEGEDAEYYDQVFRDRIKEDPALAAADLAWFDANLGTRYLGTFYESCEEDWAETINLTKNTFMHDQSVYYGTIRAFLMYLDHAEVSLERGADLDDQMYMNPYTVDGIPDIIVMETNDHEGLFLVYTFNVKGEEVSVAYRIECGFQPTNVEEVMHITPTPAPTPQPTPTPAPTPTPTPTPVPETDPTPPPETEPETEPSTRPPKDPTQGTHGDIVAPNDDTGPGPDTNSGVGSTTSAADRNDTSTSYGSYEEYETAMEDLESINNSQRQGGDSNSPSTRPVPIIPSAPTTVDNNAGTGNGGAGIDTPTETQPLARDAESGETISTTPGTAWGGPPD